MPDNPVRINSREELIYLLSEAAEVEHGVMCSYLFAAFSMKDGGADGLDIVRRLLSQAPGYLRPGGRVLVEVSPEQLDAVCDAATRLITGARVSFHRDLLGLPRVVEVQLEGAALTNATRRTGARA